jgi:hypothetical protein
MQHGFFFCRREMKRESTKILLATPKTVVLQTALIFSDGDKKT